MNLQEIHTALIKQEAKQLGFSFCGISKAGFLEEEAPRVESWLQAGHHGQMLYMEDHFDKRLDPRKLVDGAKSVVSLLFNYYTNQHQTDAEAPKISKYAFGEDYHFVVKDKLSALLETIRSEIGEVNGRAFVDSAPVLERAWAVKSGLGWVGKNSNLITKTQGSFFFLCELIIDLDLSYDTIQSADYCGTCNACIEACPTDAIIQDRVVDGSKCISYFTIELKEELPAAYKNKFENWMFGCDICQDVCPWNRFSRPHQESRFIPSEGLLKRSKQEWREITQEVFQEIFKKSAVKRTKYNGLTRNIVFLEKAE